MPRAVAMQREDLPMVLTMKQVQEITGLSKPVVYDLAHTAGFPAIRFGRAIRVPREPFFKWLEMRVGGIKEG